MPRTARDGVRDTWHDVAGVIDRNDRHAADEERRALEKERETRFQQRRRAVEEETMEFLISRKAIKTEDDDSDVEVEWLSSQQPASSSHAPSHSAWPLRQDGTHRSSITGVDPDGPLRQDGTHKSSITGVDHTGPLRQDDTQKSSISVADSLISIEHQYRVSLARIDDPERQLSIRDVDVFEESQEWQLTSLRGLIRRSRQFYRLRASASGCIDLDG